MENVINFDFPPTPNDYVHRVGRYGTILVLLPSLLYLVNLAPFYIHSTARGFECGTALTFVCPADEQRLREVEERLRGDGEE